MKRIIFGLIILCVFVLSGAFFIKPIILFLAEEHLKKVFPDSIVAIDDCTVELFHQLTLSNIKIKKYPFYDFSAAQVTIQYTPVSIMHATILRVLLSNAVITINMPGQSMQSFKEHLNRGDAKSAFVFNSFDVSNIKFNLTTKEVKAKAALSFVFDVRNQLLRSCNFTIDSLSSGGFQVNNASLNVSQIGPMGVCFIDHVKYGDVALRDVKGSARLEDVFLVIDSLSAEFLGGVMRLDARLSIDQAMHYSARVEFTQLDLDTVTNDFKLQEKVKLHGKVGGVLKIQGSGVTIETIGGDLSATEEGGELTIKDETYLNNLARNTNQSFDIIVDSFKNYHYNTGIMKLFLQDGDLIFDMQLDGESGKRNLNVIVHDFKVKTQLTE